VRLSTEVDRIVGASSGAPDDYAPCMVNVAGSATMADNVMIDFPAQPTRFDIGVTSALSGKTLLASTRSSILK